MSTPAGPTRDASPQRADAPTPRGWESTRRGDGAAVFRRGALPPSPCPRRACATRASAPCCAPGVLPSNAGRCRCPWRPTWRCSTLSVPAVRRAVRRSWCSPRSRLPTGCPPVSRRVESPSCRGVLLVTVISPDEGACGPLDIEGELRRGLLARRPDAGHRGVLASSCVRSWTRDGAAASPGPRVRTASLRRPTWCRSASPTDSGATRGTEDARVHGRTGYDRGSCRPHPRPPRRP